jgi:hypothetical protein
MYQQTLDKPKKHRQKPEDSVSDYKELGENT